MDTDSSTATISRTKFWPKLFITAFFGLAVYSSFIAGNTVQRAVAGYQEFPYDILSQPTDAALPAGWEELRKRIEASFAPGTKLSFLTDDQTSTGKTYKVQMLQYELAPYLLHLDGDESIAVGYFDDPANASPRLSSLAWSLPPYYLFISHAGPQ